MSNKSKKVAFVSFGKFSGREVGVIPHSDAVLLQGMETFKVSALKRRDDRGLVPRDWTKDPEVLARVAAKEEERREVLKEILGAGHIVLHLGEGYDELYDALSFLTGRSPEEVTFVFGFKDAEDNIFNKRLWCRELGFSETPRIWTKDDGLEKIDVLLEEFLQTGELAAS